LFYKVIAADARISNAYFSLYMALLHQLKINGGKNPLLIERSGIMKMGKYMPGIRIINV